MAAIELRCAVLPPTPMHMHLYRLDTSAARIGEQFGADAGKDPWDGGYIAPGRFAPVVITGKEGRYLIPRLWGVPPPPKVALIGGEPVYSVRNIDSPFWIGTLRHTQYRCLIPATSFMVWGPPSERAGGGDARRAQHWFTLPADPVFAIAGIWRDSEIPSFAMLSCPPNATIARIRDTAMPVILAPWDHDRWMHGTLEEIRGLIEPMADHMMVETSKPPLR